MKILIFATYFQYPILEGETIRNYNLLRYLSAKHTFYLMTYLCNSPQEIKKLFNKVYIVKKHPNVSRTFSEKISNVFQEKTDIFEDSLQQQETSKIINNVKPDLIWISNSVLFRDIPKDNDVPVLVYSDGDTYPSLLELKGSRSFAEIKVNFISLVKSYFIEKHFLKKSNCYVFPSESDANFFKKLFPNFKNVETITNGVDTEFFKPLGIRKMPYSIVFTGSLDFDPNIKGILYFCRKIFPIIQAQIPKVSLTLVGKNPPLEIQRLNSRQITVEESVDDVRPFIDRAGLFICANLTGSGIKNSILQAWAMEKAVVATHAASGGLAIKEGWNIMIRNSPTGFAKAVIGLLNNEEKRNNMGKNARQTVLEHNSWQKKAEEIDSLISNLVKNK
jgi:polysaccharide biosynthesis protein PslH